MAEWFVFVDTAYYPYVANPVKKGDDGVYRYLPIVADRDVDVFADGVPPADESRVGRPTGDEEVFVVAWDQVRRFAEGTVEKKGDEAKWPQRAGDPMR